MSKFNRLVHWVKGQSTGLGWVLVRVHHWSSVGRRRNVLFIGDFDLFRGIVDNEFRIRPVRKWVIVGIVERLIWGVLDQGSWHNISRRLKDWHMPCGHRTSWVFSLWGLNRICRSLWLRVKRWNDAFFFCGNLLFAQFRYIAIMQASVWGSIRRERILERL